MGFLIGLIMGAAAGIYAERELNVSSAIVVWVRRLGGPKE